MRVVFMGTPDAAVPSLRELTKEFDVVCVYTRPDKPRGRGRHVSSSPVKDAALAAAVEVVQPSSLRREAERLTSFEPDVVAVVAYGMILPPSALAVPRLGCVNVHFSLLPRWRGAAPVERAVLAGDGETGVTTMLMEEGMDTGPILLQERMPIAPTDTSGSLTDNLAVRGASLLVRTLREVADGALVPRPQPHDGVTVAPRITTAEAELDVAEDAVSLERRVRAFDPAPGAFVTIAGARLKVWSASVVPGEGEAGTIVAVTSDGIDVQTRAGRLRLVVVQPEGKRRMTAAEFVRGHPLRAGTSVR